MFVGHDVGGLNMFAVLTSLNPQQRHLINGVTPQLLDGSFLLALQVFYLFF